MKITSLRIEPKSSWNDVSEKNPLICTVKVSDDVSVVETMLNDNDAHELLLMVQGIVARAAKRNIDAFVAEVTAIQSSETQGLIA